VAIRRENVTVPKLLRARPPLDAARERKIRKLAGSQRAPDDRIRRARIVARSWDGRRTAAIAAELGCHPQTVRERMVRFNAAGLDGRSPEKREAGGPPGGRWPPPVNLRPSLHRVFAAKVHRGWA